MLDEVVRNLRYAVRSFGQRPLFTGVLVGTLALGIGSNVAIFSVADAVLFAPLPYGEPERLALLWHRFPRSDVDRSLVSGPDLYDYRAEATSFEGFAGAAAITGALTGEGPAEPITSGYVTPDFFDLLRVTPRLGRTFQPGDDFAVDPEAFAAGEAELPPGKIMLTWDLWQRRFGGDPAILGRSVQIDGFGSEVVGVLPEDFHIYLPPDAGMPTDIDVWGVLPSNLMDMGRDAPWLTVVTRVREGVTMEEAQREMDAITSRFREIHPFHASQETRAVVAGMHDDIVAHARPTLLALLGSVGFVLLIACANVANLLLVRASGRDREIAVRAALGSGRGRIVAQMLTESALLAAAGATLGLALAWYAVRLIERLVPATLPRADTVAIDGNVLVFTVALTAVAAAVFSLAPALRAVRRRLADALKDRGSDAGGIRGNKLRTALVVSEVALSLVLLVGAGLLLRTLAELRRVEPGFDATNVVTFTAPVPLPEYPTAALRNDFMNELRDRLRDLPGVESAGGVMPLPLAGGEQYSVGGYGRPGDPDDVFQANTADYKAVVPGYFEALRIRVEKGRALERADNLPEAQGVVVIDRQLAERAFPGESPLGKELVLTIFDEGTFAVERTPMQVVGVAADVRSSSLSAEGRPTVYLPYLFNSYLPPTFVVRTSGETTGLLARIREEVVAMNRNVPVSQVATLDSYLRAAMAPTRFVLLLVSVFAGLALVLASLGLYGVIGYSVRQRTREIGVRMAFGAGRGEVLRLVLGQGVLLAAAGVAAGLLGAFALTPVVESMLVGVPAADPATFAAVALLLLAVAAAASLVPALRATRIDPVEALRDD